MRSLVVALLVLAPSVALAAESPEPEAIYDSPRLDQELARCESIATTASSEDAQFAALCKGACYAFRLSEPEGDKADGFAQRGLALAKKAREVRPFRVEGHYWYALCLGIVLRENKLSGLTRVDELIAESKRVVELDETYDHGGGHRILARLYAEAPRLVGPGDHDRAKKHLARLLEVAGDHDENKLVAAHVSLEIGEKKKARGYLATVDPKKGKDEHTREEWRAELARLKKALE